MTTTFIERTTILIHIAIKMQTKIWSKKWKKGNPNLHINITCQFCYHNKRKKYYFVSVFCFLSIILKKMLKICNIVNHFKVIITVSLKKSCFSTFNFVNKVEMYILPFEIFHRIFVCLRDYAIFILMNLSTCPQNGYFVFFLYWAKGNRNRNDF